MKNAEAQEAFRAFQETQAGSQLTSTAYNVHASACSPTWKKYSKPFSHMPNASQRRLHLLLMQSRQKYNLLHSRSRQEWLPFLFQISPHGCKVNVLLLAVPNW